MSTRFEKARELLISHRKQVSKLGGRHLAIFGSTARNEATKKSDIDILVDFDTKKDLFGFIDLKFYLEDLLSCNVDLMTKQALHPALKKRFSMKPSKSSRDWSFRIKDILQAIDKIEQYTENKTLSEFKKNTLVSDAVIRNFEVIEEASVHIPLDFHDSHPEIPWKQMRAMRNLLIHQFFCVNEELVWHSASPCSRT